MRKNMKDIMQSNGLRWMILWSARVSIFVLSGVMAFLLRFDLSLPPAYIRYLVYALPVWILVKSVTFHFANLNLRGLRYVSIADVYRIVTRELRRIASELGDHYFHCSRGFPAFHLFKRPLPFFLGYGWTTCSCSHGSRGRARQTGKCPGKKDTYLRRRRRRHYSAQRDSEQSEIGVSRLWISRRRPGQRGLTHQWYCSPWRWRRSSGHS